MRLGSNTPSVDQGIWNGLVAVIKQREFVEQNTELR